MGNNPSGRSRGNDEDSESSRLNAPTQISSKKKSIVAHDGQGEDTITKILNQTSMMDVHSRHRMSTSYSETNSIASEQSGRTMDENRVARTLPTVFKWEGGGKDVFISGTFNGWKAKIPMVKSHQNFYTIIDLPEGEHKYKFIVDGHWKIDTHQPSITDNNDPTNVIAVKPSDFDVLEALSHDVANSKSSAAKHHSVSAGPPSRRLRTHSVDDRGEEIPKPMNNPQEQVRGRFGSGNTLSGSPPGEYGQEEPPRSMAMGDGSNTNKVLTPPLLPPQLLQVILNKTTGAQCDPNLLPHPNHVMVNHMYALSIKDGVIVLSAITRYRKKFVSTVIYKPI